MENKNFNIHSWHREIEDGCQRIVFDNKQVDELKYFIGDKEEFSANELVNAIKKKLLDKKKKRLTYTKAIPVMQFLHNFDIRIFDYDLAVFYSEGKYAPKDEVLAAELYRGVASTPYNDAISMRRLADCYQFGKGVPVDATTAMYWYERGAKYGDEYAALNAGVHYARGLGEVKPNRTKALYYLRLVKDNRQYKKIAREWLHAIKKGEV